MLPSFVVIVLTGLAGIVAYCVLFETIFFQNRKPQVVAKSARIAIALFTPGVLAAFLVFVVGTRLSADRAASIASGFLFPWFVILPILLLKLIVTAVMRFYKTGELLSHDDENKLAVGAGGCMIPVFLVIAVFIVSALMGVKMHDYNPYMDGPPPEHWLCGVDMVKVVERFGGMALVASFSVCIYLGIRLAPPMSKWKLNKIMKPGEFLVVTVILGVMFALLWPAVKAARGPDRYSIRQSCDLNLKIIELAMLSYHDKYDSLPPAYTVDADGKPLHSWRVLLLPFLTHEEWFHQIRLDEPWDSDHNRQFHQFPVERFPREKFHPFRCPENKQKEGFWAFLSDDEPKDKDRDRCDYSVTVGPNTLFPGAESSGKVDLNDPSNADKFLIVERRTPICWMDPTREITEETAAKGVNADPDGIGSSNHSGANVVYANGRTKLLTP